MIARKILFAACVIGLAGFAMPAVTASSASAAALQIQPADAGIRIVPVAERHHGDRMDRRWDRRRHGDRCSRWRANCRHYYRGYYYASPWWVVPPFVGGAIYYHNNYNHRSNRSEHVRWCMDHYRSYNPRTDTWVAYGGEVRRCVSPYRR